LSLWRRIALLISTIFQAWLWAIFLLPGFALRRMGERIGARRKTSRR
jgi:hypothetical protein